MQQRQSEGSSNMNRFGIFQDQENGNCQSNSYNWNTNNGADVIDENDAQSIDNILDRSGLLDELVTQILDDGSTPAEEDKPARSFSDVVNAKEFVPSSNTWSYVNNRPNTLTQRTNMMGMNSTEQMNMGRSQELSRAGMGNFQPFPIKGSGKVINPPPGFEQNSNLNDLKQIQDNNQNQHFTKPPISEIEILKQHTTLSSSMFLPHQSPNHQSNASEFGSAQRPYQDFQQQVPFHPSQVAQSLLQRRTNSPRQLLLSDAGSGSSHGSIDSPILSPSSVSGMSSTSNPPSPFETNTFPSDNPTISQSNPTSSTKFNFKAPPFFPSSGRPSPLGWKAVDNNPFRPIQQRSESPVDFERSFSNNNMPMDPPPMNRMLKGNFPMQPLPLPPSGKPFSTMQNIHNFPNSQGNYMNKDRSSPAPFYNSNSGRSSPFPFQNKQPTMGPYGDSLNDYNRFGQNQAQFSAPKQRFNGMSGFPNNSGGNVFAMQQLLLQQQLQQRQQQQQQPGLCTETPTGRLHVQLDECCIHVKRLEDERKKTEFELAQMHPGKRISSSNTIQAPQLPDNPSQVDRIIVDVYKEHSRLVTLMSKIEGLCTKPLHANLEACLDAWMTSIQEAEAKRHLEIRNATRRQQERRSPSNMNEEEVTQLADGIEKMKNATRAARTTLWSAFQMAKEDFSDKEKKESVREN